MVTDRHHPLHYRSMATRSIRCLGEELAVHSALEGVPGDGLPAGQAGMDVSLVADNCGQHASRSVQCAGTAISTVTFEIVPTGPLRSTSRKRERALSDGDVFDRAKDHYQVLGVSKRADAKALAFAWRRAAARWHTDREGGDASRFRRSELAYAVLSDPARRKHYDETGEDHLPTPVDEKARGLLEEAFDAFIDEEGEGLDCVQFVRDGLDDGLSQAVTELLSATKKLRSATKKSKAVKTKKGKINLYAEVVRRRIETLTQATRRARVTQIRN